MILPVMLLVLVMGCWVFIWQLGLHTTEFVAQESARAASTSNGLPADPDAATADPDTDDATATEVNTVAAAAQTAAQNAIDRSYLHGIAAGSPCPTTPASGAVCFIQEPPCTQGSGSGFCDSVATAAQCLSGATIAQSLWVCEWYEVPNFAADSDHATNDPDADDSPYKVKVIVAGWFNVGLPVFGGNLPIAAEDTESIQHCGGCP